MCCHLLFSATFKSQPSALVLAGGRAVRYVLPCWGEDECAWGKQALGAGISVRSSQLWLLLPLPSVLLLHSWSVRSESSAPGEL